MSNINLQNPGQTSPDDDKPAQSSSQKTDNLKNYFSSPNKRGPVEEVVSPPRKEGRFAKAKYYNRGKEEASKPKNEHTSPSPGRRRGGITRKKKVVPPLEIEEELANLGIDFNTTPGPEAWMPLELFDDRNCDDMTLAEWGEKLQIQPLAAKGLYKNAKYEWKEIVIFSYDESSEKFVGEWRDDGSQAKLSRIFVCFYDEDSRKFAQRIANALRQRVYADSILRYNYYIDNMPVKDLSEITPEQEMRIEKLATDTRTLRDLKFDLRNLREEAEKNYARTMNKIIFDKYMMDHSKDLLPQRLELPSQSEETPEAPYFGLIQLPKSKETKEFTEAFKDFCLKSLFIKEEAVKASQEIHNKCGECLEKKLFYTAFSYPITIEDFKYQQESTYSQIVNYLQHGWVDEIVKISRAHFSQQGTGWFSVAPTRDTYDLGKLKKFLTMSKQMMQDVLLSMTRSNFENFYQCISKYVPDRVIIQGTSVVKNEFDNLQPTVSGKLETIPPLFYVDLIKPYMKEEFAYSALPSNFVLAVTDVFDRTLNELAKIPDLEQKVLAELEGPLKAARFMKVPRKPQENPGETPDQEKYKFIVDENKWLYDVYSKLKDIMEKAVQPLEEYLKVYDPYKDILKINPDQYIRDLEQQQDQPKTEEDIKKEINEFKKKEEDLKAGIPDDMHISCFWVNCRELTGILAGKYSHMQKNLKGYIAKRARERTQKLQEIFKEMEKKILTQPENIEELTNLKEYLQQLPLEIEKVKVDITKCMDIYAILEDFQYPLTTDDLNKRWLVFGGPKDVMERVDTRKQVLEKEKSRFQDEMVEKQEEFKENIENLERSVLGFHQFHKIEQHEEVAKMAASINESLAQFSAEAKTFNHHETLFGVEVTDYSKIQQLQKEFAPYSNLWITSNQWFHNIQHWLHCDWENLDAEEGERFVEEAVRTMGSVIRFFRDRGINQVLKIAEKVKAEIDEFRPKVPLMVALRKKGMKERHWQQISDKVGFTVQPEEEFTFSKALDMGLMKNAEDIVEIGERAAKEFAIEVMLNDMMAVWDKINFELLPFKQTWIIRGYDEINAILDEHIVQTQAMQFSPFKKPFEEKINEWNDRLLHMSTILEEWAKCQGQYMYLQPIFDSPDIAKQLPVESKKFKSVDSTWKFTLSTTKSIGNVLRVCSDEGPTEGLLTKIQEANASLEVIQKELNNYLERKREAFARFYFLSNDELLEILSQTKEPTAVQPHLRKVFENIFKVDFDADKIIHAMYSGEGEKVSFVKTIDPTKKNVEFWMGDLEEMMKVSVRDVLLNSVHDYLKTERTKWVISHPGQCVLNGSQVHWTSEVETAIKQNKLNEYLDKSRKQISDLVRLIRTKLSAMQSITINALIVIDVHAKDVVEKLYETRIDDISAFEWISQLRYYWENDDCYVKCIQTCFPYGYEYLGNTLRLVITPLTDKCYMTLMGALKLNLGGAPAGPAGTGKTESTKDLAKALAKQCVVFNCSEGMDYTFVGKFFKGLASAGAWACFDEFNRINVEVLSVIAQQLLTLFGAKAREEKSIEFEGSNIKMNPTFCVFITMNPGYAGRTELPDNLKALFRPVAMMVPDYAMIGEIMLYSFGFDTARDLAGKMVATFKLSSEQLSSQDHYDYGMRAVRSVINAAGLLKRAEPDMDEQQLLLRALRDVNVPKFLKDDLPLFENIISDLFPDIERPQINYGDLLDGIKRACVKHNLQATDPFIQKVLQLYDTIQVRHGLMIVGPTGGGKTANYKVLQDAMGILAKEHKSNFTKVETHILNPKSITMGQLYGWINESTKEWTDGILAYMVRETVKDASGVKHWVMFDGPVDALWIESMNTVLDDNKKLCLNSGQILVLTPYMTMMFEVEDLAVASPATVSRCGMVYMEPVALGIRPLFDSWIERLPANIKAKQTFVPNLNKLFDSYVEQTIEFVKKYCRETVPTMVNALVQSLFKLLDCYLEGYRENEYKKVPVEEIENLENILEPLFIFCMIWSLGCTVELEGRKKFNDFFKQLMVTNQSKVVLPEDGSLYDFNFNMKTKAFEDWSEANKNFEIDAKLSYSEIAVPTKDYTRMLFLMKLLLTNDMHVMCPGPTGTGKSLNAYTLLQTALSETYQYIAITFSAQTSANQTQDTIDSKLEKRRKGYFGPPTGKKCIVFVDDLNMPKKETYGAQPPIEILRQYLDHKGWYDVKKLEYRNLQDLILLTAMGPPGGGRTFITNRFVRHFNMLTYTDLDENTIRSIFGVIVQFFLSKFTEPVKAAQKTLVDTVLHVYDTVKAELRPTPAKSFYTFNLRDISKVFQGICSASAKHCSETSHIVRLWYHENLRVFHDRLTTEEDRLFLKGLLKSQFEKFGTTAEEVLDVERIIFGDFMQGREAEPKYYIQIRDIKALLEKMESYLEDYNSEGLGGSKKQMKLVMFLDACEHIARIARILRQPQGNALLLGVGGSGRQSLARMATFISGYRLFQVEVVKGYNMNKWRDDLKKCLMIAGVENKPVTFLFVDTQIINEQMLEDINNILNTGDVSNIYKNEDYDNIYNACRAECSKKGIQPNKMNMFGVYLARVQRNIHCVIAMSPLGEVFRTRLRMFPSLINCATIDWFTEWPEEALIGVGKGSLIEVIEDLEIGHISDKLVEMFKTVHKSVEKISISFLAELRRHNYVTPTSYLEQLNLFKSILGEKKVDLKNQIDRLSNGLEKLKEANEAVLIMEVELKDMQPKLEQAEIDTTKMMERLVVDKQAADEAQILVAKDEAEATKQQQEALALQSEALEAVSSAQKMLDKTMEDVRSLEQKHLDEIKAFKNPPEAVFWTLAGVCVMLGEKVPLKPVPGSLTNEKREDYFEYAKKELLSNPKEFLKRLLDFAYSEQKNNIPADRIIKLNTKIKPEPAFAEDKVEKANIATKYLWGWVNAMYQYNETYVSTKPLREKLAATEKILSEKTAELNIKKAELAKITATIESLQQQYDETIREKERLTNRKAECEIKLERANKLTSGLKDEKERWSKEVEVLLKRKEVLAGDSVIAAAMITYAGPFTSQFRNQLETGWVHKLDEIGIKHTPNINMRAFLGDSVKIQNWNIAGLPKDDSSTENGIIIDKARRWPLMIDPQTQANKFIKNLGKEHEEGIEILKLSDPNLLRTIEISIQHGKWVMVENIGTELDPALEPILLQQTFKAGGTLSITIGDRTIGYSEHFKFFMTTTNPNPHYPPETFVKVTIINFAITPSGLEEQMLAQIVALEDPQLEQKKTEIVKKNAQDRKELLALEDGILKSLSESQGDILMDETLINKLASSKKMSTEINQRVKDSKITEEQIDTKRESYRPAAFRASILFFCIMDLSNIDPMYQYSLQWFINLFAMGVENAPQSNEHSVRLNNLNNYFTYSLYENVCRSLFEKHKLLFSLLLAVKLLKGDNKLDEEEWFYLLAGFTGEATVPPNPTKWVPDNSWPGMYRQFHGMDFLPKLKGVREHMLTKPDDFKEIYDEVEAHEQPLPEPWNSKLDELEKMIVLKAIRPDKLIPAIQNWVTLKIGKQFVEPPSFNLANCFKDATVTTPLIFVLSPGSDPVADFQRFAEEMGFLKKYEQISLGQGQGPKAEKMIREYSQRGGWVLLQNCHLAISWMSELEKICEGLDENIHKDFRLWLTSMPTPAFPISVLQNGVKMTLEPPTGLRANLQRTYNTMDDKELADCKKPDAYKKLLFGFALFHATVLERRKFGPIGWNIPYEFTNEDFAVCKKQLKVFLDEYDEIPFKVLNYIGAEINYGGRVTDDKDVRLIKTILETYIVPGALNDGYKYSESGLYHSAAPGDQADYINYIKGLPLNPAPEAFGLHDNAEISTAENTTRVILETILSTQPRSTAKSGKSAEEILIDAATNLEKRTPPVFDFDAIYKQYPTEYTESMNTVLVQEIIRYNRLLAIMPSSLANLKKAVKGEIVMSEELELMAKSLGENQVPEIWKARSFLSLKPLSSWIEDLNERITFLNGWIKNGTPNVFWISGLFFPQAFITGALQNYARKHVIAIDRLGLDFKIMDDKTHADIKQKPESGCYIYGMFIEGARWDPTHHALNNSKPKELYTELPLIWLVPVADRKQPETGIYNCPVYKVLSRAGTLSTTGHSTNFVMYIEIPSVDPESKWIKAGVAGFLSLRY